MIGTIVNTIAVILGSVIGLLFKKWIKKEYCDRVLKIIGISVLAISAVGIVKAMISINNDHEMSSHYELLLIVCVAVGTLIGEVLKIDDHINNAVNKIESKFNKKADTEATFSKGFISASLVACVGAMAIVGSIHSALGDPSMLYIKSIIDFVTMIFLAATLGYGVAFSAISVFIYQGVITILGYILGDFISNEFTLAFTAIGYTLMLCIAFNFIADTKIKVANTLPSILLLILYFVIKSFIEV